MATLNVDLPRPSRATLVSRQPLETIPETSSPAKRFVIAKELLATVPTNVFSKGHDRSTAGRTYGRPGPSGLMRKPFPTEGDECVPRTKDTPMPDAPADENGDTFRTARQESIGYDAPSSTACDLQSVSTLQGQLPEAEVVDDKLTMVGILPEPPKEDQNHKQENINHHVAAIEGHAQDSRQSSHFTGCRSSQTEAPAILSCLPAEVAEPATLAKIGSSRISSSPCASVRQLEYPPGDLSIPQSPSEPDRSTSHNMNDNTLFESPATSDNQEVTSGLPKSREELLLAFTHLETRQRLASEKTIIQWKDFMAQYDENNQAMLEELESRHADAISTHVATISWQKNAIESHERNTAEHEALVADNASTIARQESQLSALTAECQKYISDISTFETVRGEWESCKEELTGKCVEYEIKSTQLEEQLAAAEKEFTQVLNVAENKRAQFEEKSRSLESENAQTRSSYIAFEQELCRLKTAYDLLENESAQLEGENQRLDEECSQLKIDNSNGASAYSKLASKYEGLRHQSETRVEELQANLAERSIEQRALQEQIAEQDKNLQEKLADFATKQKDIEQESELRERRLRNDMADLVQAKEKIEQQNVDRQLDFAEKLKDLMIAHEASNAHSESRERQLEDKLDALELRYKVLMEESNDREKKLQSDLGGARAKHDELMYQSAVRDMELQNEVENDDLFSELQGSVERIEDQMPQLLQESFQRYNPPVEEVMRAANSLQCLQDAIQETRIIEEKQVEHRQRQAQNIDQKLRELREVPTITPLTRLIEQVETRIVEAEKKLHAMQAQNESYTKVSAALATLANTHDLISADQTLEQFVESVNSRTAGQVRFREHVTEVKTSQTTTIERKYHGSNSPSPTTGQPLKSALKNSNRPMIMDVVQSPASPAAYQGYEVSRRVGAPNKRQLSTSDSGRGKRTKS